MTIYLPGVVISRFLPAPDKLFSLELALWSLLVTPIASVVAFFSAWVALQAIEGNGSGTTVRAAFSSLPTVYLASGVISLIAVAGLFAFVIPGVVWGLACTVAIPAAAVERLGIMDAIRRSFDLTRGRRLALFGYTMAIFLPLALVSMLIELAFVGGSFELLDSSPVKPFFETFAAMIGAAFSAAVYIELVQIETRRLSGARA